MTRSSRPTRTALASSDKPVDLDDPRGVAPPDATRGVTTLSEVEPAPLPRRAFAYVGGWKSDAAARWTFIWPSVIVVLFLSIFPLFASLTLAFGKLVFQKGKVDVGFVGFSNFPNLLFGTERTHLLGLARTPTPLGWLVLIVVAVLLVRALVRSLRSGRVGVGGAIARVVGALFGIGLAWLVAQTMLSDGGRPGIARRHAVLRLRRDRGHVRPGPGAGDPRGPAAARPAVLPGRVPAAADDHAGRRRLHVPDDDRHREGPARSRCLVRSGRRATHG